MKKTIFKIAFMVIILVGASNYMMYIITGNAPLKMSLPDFSSVSVPSIEAPNLEKVMGSKKEQAYKWKDKDGVMHYSSEPPPEGHVSELIKVDPNTNLIQGFESKQKKAEEKETATETLKPAGNVYNHETIKSLMDDAKSVQDTLNKRYEDLDNM